MEAYAAVNEIRKLKLKKMIRYIFIPQSDHGIKTSKIINRNNTYVYRKINLSSYLHEKKYYICKCTS